MRTEIKDAIREIQKALETGDFCLAIGIVRHAYRAAADTDERAELLLYLGPNAAREPLAAMESVAPEEFLGRLAALRAMRDQLDREIRESLAYGREFTQPRPYTLTALAEAARMTPSGVRTAYTSADIDAVAQAVGRAPRAR
ncbi:hypothetical protein [Streptomyces sp. NBC_00648]|uniref:hypothetical protein n=1 Tax=Streptomyces sp. NBC_00648 TaxID=2975797 RepID=UPI00324360E1